MSARGRPRGRRLAIYVLALLCVAAALGGWGFWSRARGPALPAPDLAASDPLVRAAVETAVSRVRENRGSGAAWGELGMVLLAHELFVEARSAFSEASRLDPREPCWPYLLGLAELKGVPERAAAIAALERAAALAGAEPAPRLLLGEELLEEGRLDEAEARFGEALRTQPGNPRAELGLGRVAHRRGRFEEALAHLGVSLKAAPQVRATHLLLAEVHFRLGDREAAERERRAAAPLPETYLWPDPYETQVYQRWTGALSRIDQASGLFQQGRKDEALEILQRTVSEEPEAILPRLMLGRLLLQSGRTVEAEEALREAVRRSPEAFEAHHELASALEKQAKTAEAAAEYREALKKKPDYGPAHQGLAGCLLRQGDREGAIAELKETVRYRPDSSQALRELGRLLAQAGRREEALERLKSAVQLNPADAEAGRLLEEVTARAGDGDAAPGAGQR